MKALVSNLPGGPDTLEIVDLPEPSVGPGELRVRVVACGINYPDVLVIEDKYQARPTRPFSPGAEFSGIVDAVGEGVEGFAPGDRILAAGRFGALAELVVIDAVRCHHLPDTLSFETGAAIQFTYATSYHALQDRARLQPGETLFVMGAAGGVGLTAVELGRMMGATVIAGVSSEEKAQAARAAGAHATLIYPAGPLDTEAQRAFSKAIRETAGGDVDVVYDPVGGSFAEPALRTLAWEGRYLVIGFPAGIPNIPLNLTLLKGCQIIGVFAGAYSERFPDRYRAMVDELIEKVAKGELRPVISNVFPLEQGGAAIAELADRKAKGKVIVRVAAQP
ncbi:MULTISPECIES: NADPH:quinone oxidoreductase family protein [Sphingobium]|uniref:NADPH:quinone oxidoreductase family protein n=1 Tax=Sphingobium TaxID=165695 RepID=UPI00159C1DF7|nr:MULTISPECIES: NADPH:quinone oxidoreductase family protein [unclassified Sphingobium]